MYYQALLWRASSSDLLRQGMGLHVISEKVDVAEEVTVIGVD